MTSSYNASRRPQNDNPIDWETYIIPEYKTCPMGTESVPLFIKDMCGQRASAWKYCVPVKSCAERKREADKVCDTTRSCGRARNLYQDYGRCDDCQNPNLILPKTAYDTRELLEKDYFNLPAKFNTTGLDSDDYGFATYNMSFLEYQKPVWEKTRFIQTHEINNRLL